jgi:hypothetical protein
LDNQFTDFLAGSRHVLMHRSDEDESRNVQMMGARSNFQE